MNGGAPALVCSAGQDRAALRTRIYWVKVRCQFERIYVLSDGNDIFTAWPYSKRLNEIRRQMNEPKPFVRLRPVINDDH
jgi:hypothetical protein